MINKENVITIERREGYQKYNCYYCMAMDRGGVELELSVRRESIGSLQSINNSISIIEQLGVDAFIRLEGNLFNDDIVFFETNHRIIDIEE